MVAPVALLSRANIDGISTGPGLLSPGAVEPSVLDPESPAAPIIPSMLASEAPQVLAAVPKLSTVIDALNKAVTDGDIPAFDALSIDLNNTLVGLGDAGDTRYDSSVERELAASQILNQRTEMLLNNGLTYALEMSTYQGDTVMSVLSALDRYQDHSGEPYKFTDEQAQLSLLVEKVAIEQLTEAITMEANYPTGFGIEGFIETANALRRNGLMSQANLEQLTTDSNRLLLERLPTYIDTIQDFITSSPGRLFGLDEPADMANMLKAVYAYTPAEGRADLDELKGSLGDAIASMTVSLEIIPEVHRDDWSIDAIQEYKDSILREIGNL